MFPTSHERRSGEPWDAYYRNGSAPWDIGGPQPAVTRLAAKAGFTGPLLDVGFGTGDNALHVASLGVSVLGVELAETAVAIARAKAEERGIAAQFVNGSAFELERLRRTFRTVLDCGLFHSLDDEERLRYVASLGHVTGPDGKVYVLCFSDEGADIGPHPVSRKELQEAFDPSRGWRVDVIEPERIETRVHDNGVAAWLATIKRID